MTWISKVLAPSSVNDLHDKITAEMANMGWTLHDQVSATDEVWKSNGEAGDRIYEYIQLTVSAANILYRAWGWWNSSTHAGSSAAYYQASINAFAYVASGKYTISGNKDFVSVKQNGAATTTLTWMMFGHIPNRVYEKPLGILQDAESAGSAVAVALDDATGFVPNKTYQIFGAAGEGRDQVKVTAVDFATNTITIETLLRDYGAGSMIGVQPSTFFHSGGRYASLYYQLMPTCFYNRVGTADSTSYNNYWLPSALLAIAGLDPEYRLGAGTGTTGLYVLQPLLCTEYGSEAAIGYWDDLVLMPPETGQDNRVYAIPANDATIESGTCTGGSGTTIVCAGKGWTNDEWIGYVVVLTDGTGAGQIREILDNDTDTLTVNTWDTNPVNGSTVFYICEEAYRAYGSYEAVKENP